MIKIELFIHHLNNNSYTSVQSQYFSTFINKITLGNNELNASNVLTLYFDCTDMPSPQRCHGERSLSQRQALAISITSARQLVEPSARRKQPKGAIQYIPSCISDNPLKRCIISPNLLLQRDIITFSWTDEVEYLFR